MDSSRSQTRVPPLTRTRATWTDVRLVAGVSTREANRGVVEHSVCGAAAAAGRGVGTRLLSVFITAADEAGVWTIRSSIFPENLPSLVLHDMADFRAGGRRERVARMSYGQVWSGLRS